MSDEQNFRVVSNLEVLLGRERQITKYGYNLNILKRTNMDKKPADSNGRLYLQTKKARRWRNYRTFQSTRYQVPGTPSV